MASRIRAFQELQTELQWFKAWPVDSAEVECSTGESITGKALKLLLRVQLLFHAAICPSFLPASPRLLSEKQFRFAADAAGEFSTLGELEERRELTDEHLTQYYWQLSRLAFVARQAFLLLPENWPPDLFLISVKQTVGSGSMDGFEITHKLRWNFAALKNFNFELVSPFEDPMFAADLSSFIQTSAKSAEFELFQQLLALLDATRVPQSMFQKSSRLTDRSFEFLQKIFSAFGLEVDLKNLDLANLELFNAVKAIPTNGVRSVLQESNFRLEIPRLFSSKLQLLQLQPAELPNQFFTQSDVEPRFAIAALRDFIAEN